MAWALATISKSRLMHNWKTFSGTSFTSGRSSCSSRSTSAGEMQLNFSNPTT